jgi:hypothetical protein
MSMEHLYIFYICVIITVPFCGNLFDVTRLFHHGHFMPENSFIIQSAMYRHYYSAHRDIRHIGAKTFII